MVFFVHRLTAYVPAGVRSRGLRYFKAGFVTLQGGGPEKAEAIVRGSEPYRVHIQLQGDSEVVADCSCPHRDGVCKHVWATLLAAEQAGYLYRVASRWRPELVRPYDDDEPDDMDPDALAEEERLIDEAVARHRANPKPQPLPEWRRQLATLRHLAGQLPAPAASPQPRRILYIVDLDDCLSSNGLVVKVGESSLKKNGDWGKPAFRHGSVRDPESLEPQDRQMLALLSGSDRYGYYRAANFESRHLIPTPSYTVLVPMLCKTERFCLGSLRRLEELQFLRWDDGDPWQFRLQVVLDESNSHYTLAGVLRRDDQDIPFSVPRLVLPGIVFFSDAVSRFNPGKAFEWVPFLRRTGPLTIPASQINDLRDEMVQFPALPPADLPEDLQIEARTFTSQPALRIRSDYDFGSPQHVVCEIHYNYGVLVAEKDPAMAVLDPATNRYFTRDRAAEHAAIGRLESFGMRRYSTWRSDGQWQLPSSHVPALVRALLPEGWCIEAEGKLYRNHAGLRLRVTSGIGWLDLSGSADFDGQTVELPELLRALAQGDAMIRLGDGSFGLLPEDWLKRYRLAAGFGKNVDGRLRFSHRHASLLDALLADEPAATFDEGFQRIRREMASFTGIQAAAPPRTFKGTLREYQQEGLGWLQFTRRFGLGACLADDMGLGKTVQVLALLVSIKRAGPVLVVVPRSLVFNWIQEAGHFTPRLKVLDWSGLGRKTQWNRIPKHDLVVTTYGTLRRDIANLKDIAFDTVILDEAQAIKNATTESAKAVRLLKAEHRLVLSGTPIENRLTDLWSLFEFLNPGLLGSGTVFRTQVNGSPDKDTARILSLALRPFILRRTKEKVAKELPARTEQTIYCELDANQRRLYDQLRDHYRASLLGRIEDEGIGKSRMHILEALLRLRQAACHPGLIDKQRTKEPSAKLDALLPQIEEVTSEGHKAIIFSQFTSLLTIVKAQLDRAGIPYEYLDGKTKNRQACVRRFQEDPSCPLFLISLKAGGLGLNLTAAEYVFLLDPWWNPAAESQAIDRAHRIGQSRNVFAYRLIARDTVEEKVLELQKSKRALADAIITEDNSVLSGLTRETLELLLS
jgi:superfamily II DNA or RNA helicase